MSKDDNLGNLTSVNCSCSSAKISGKTSVNFLNNLLISDLLDFTKGIFYYSALCNPKGRVICSLWIRINSDEDIDIIYPKDMLNLLSYFKMRTFRQKIEVSETDFGIYIDKQFNNINLLQLSSASNEVINMDIYLFHFQQNLPWIDFNFTELFIPQHVNLDLHENIMSFKKGCYPGQEIVARLKYLGKIKKRMALIEFDSEEDALNSIENYQTVSPIVYNKTIKKYQLQVIENLSENAEK
jgi:folate-binding protein YgfZ